MLKIMFFYSLDVLNHIICSISSNIIEIMP